MADLQAFKDIAPYLTHPLVLVGFVLLLFFGVHRSLLKAKIIQPLTVRTGGKVVQLFLRYGFVVALAVIVLGFGLEFYKTQKQAEVSTHQHRAELAEQAKAGLEERLKAMQRQHAAAESRAEGAEEQSKILAEAVNALVQQKGPGIDEALAQLAQGNTTDAKAIFRRAIRAKEPDIKETAAAWRHLGALAFLDDTEEALVAYRRATELDPENAIGWNQLGHLLHRKGELQEAEFAYLNMANQYGNLGILYYIRGEIAQAKAMRKKSLAIEEALGRKEGMASDYGNLGVLYKTRGELDKPESMHKKSLVLFEGVGAAPQEVKVQEMLNKLKECEVKRNY